MPKLKGGLLLWYAVSGRHEVEDVTQEAFTYAYRALDKFRGEYAYMAHRTANAAKNISWQGAAAGSRRDDRGRRSFAQSRCQRGPERCSRGDEPAGGGGAYACQKSLGSVDARERRFKLYDDIADVLGCPVELYGPEFLERARR